MVTKIGLQNVGCGGGNTLRPNQPTILLMGVYRRDMWRRLVRIDGLWPARGWFRRRVDLADRPTELKM
jgi:hypothetical protein